jgi:hypothetical protein
MIPPSGRGGPHSHGPPAYPPDTESPHRPPSQPDALAADDSRADAVPQGMDALAETLADLWGPALNRSWHLGREIGYREGYAAAERDMAASWNKLWLATRATLAAPEHVELSARRERTSGPCDRCCRRGGCDETCDGCSQCIRFAGTFGNLRRYGRVDYPGSGVVTS